MPTVRFGVFSLVTCWLAGFASPVHADEPPTEAQLAELGRHFGFGQFQTYKIDDGTSLLKVADLNGDGRNDVAVWNARKSRVELFYQPASEQQAAGQPAASLERNEVPNRGNLRNESVPVSYRVAAMEIADITGDKRPDLVLFGEPKEVVVVPSRPDGGFGPAGGMRAPDGNPRGGSLAVGDYNGDGRTDVALLGDEMLLVFPQKAGGGLASPQRIVHGVKQTMIMLTADLNGDGRHDLIISVDDDEYGLIAFVQDESGSLGAMRRLRVPKMRSLTVAKGTSGDDVLCIEAVTGRLKQYHWETPAETAAMADWPQFLHAFPVKTRSKQRPVAVGDIDGDGVFDVVAADPDAAQLILFRGGPRGLTPGVAFPGLAKMLDIQIVDADGDGRSELLCVSREEKVIGVSKFEDGRITFPTQRATQGAPLAATAGALRGGGQTRQLLAYVSSDKPAAKEGESGKGEARTVLHVTDATGEAERASLTIASLDDDPRGLRIADVNQDGRDDLLLFVRFAPLRAYIQQENGTFELLSGPQSREGLVKEAALEGYALADVTGDGKPEVLLTQKNLARALAVRDGRWEVLDQYNPESTDVELKGLAALPASQGSPTLVTYDRKDRELLSFERGANNAYAVTRTMPVGVFEVQALESLPFGGERQAGLLLADTQKLAVFTPNRAAPTLVEKFAYETKIKDAFPADSIAGDINHDGVRDVLLLDTRKANIEILSTGVDGDLLKALHFQVFQGKRFSDAPDARGEPHEIQVGDVTGDGSDDVLLLAHDRLLVYPSQ